MAAVKKAIELKSRGVKMLPSKDTNHKNAVCKYHTYLYVPRQNYFAHTQTHTHTHWYICMHICITLAYRIQQTYTRKLVW